MEKTGKARLGHLSKMEKRAGAWPQVVQSWLQSGKPAERRSFHGVIADSGKPLPRPTAGWDQVPTPPLF